MGIRSCYDEGKRCAETLFFDYWRQHKLEIKVTRIFNTYGPRMHPNDGRVVSNFIVQALRGEPITIYGDGTQTRSFCYVDDLIDGMLRMMESPKDFNGPVNIGNPTEFTMLQLAEMVLKLVGSISKSYFNRCPWMIRNSVSRISLWLNLNLAGNPRSRLKMASGKPLLISVSVFSNVCFSASACYCDTGF